jgi:hypothetical protein
MTSSRVSPVVTWWPLARSRVVSTVLAVGAGGASSFRLWCHLVQLGHQQGWMSRAELIGLVADRGARIAALAG